MPEPPVDYARLVADLQRMLKLRSICLGMKLFESVEQMGNDSRGFDVPSRSTPLTRSLLRLRALAGPSALPVRIWSANNAGQLWVLEQRTPNGDPGST